MKKFRNIRKAEGWYEVRVWVPTKEDVKDIQDLAAKKREGHLLTKETPWKAIVADIQSICL